MECYFRFNTAIGQYNFNCQDPIFENDVSGDPGLYYTTGQYRDDTNPSIVNDTVNDNYNCKGVSLQEFICEKDSLYIYNIDTGYQYFHTRDILISNSKVLPYSDILFKSGNRVELQSGFEIFQNGQFEFNIEDCPDNRSGDN